MKRCFLSFGLLFGLLVPIALAGEAEPAEETKQSGGVADAVVLEEAPVQQTWQVPPPDDKTNDWLRLTNGEWFMGEIIGMQNDELEFDSDEMDEQIFDWEDVSVLVSPRENTVMFADRTRAVGTLRITDEEVIVEGDEPLSISRGSVFAIISGEPKEINFWSGKVSFGFSARSGNTDQVEFNTRVAIVRRTTGTRLGFDYLGNYTSVGNVSNANNHRLTAGLDIFLNRQLFVRAPFVEYFRDPFQNIAHQGTIGVAVGYDIFNRFNSKQFDWDVSVGPAYQRTQFDSVQGGEDDTKGGGSALLSTRFNTDITNSLELTLIYRGFISLQDEVSTTHHGESIFEIELTSRLDVDISLIWDHVADPTQREDGSFPEQDDFRTVVSLGFDF